MMKGRKMTEDEEFEDDEKHRIAALHKTAPEIIWLQIDDEVAQWDGYECQTWCEDQLNDTDLQYVRADLVEEKLMAAQVEVLKQSQVIDMTIKREVALQEQVGLLQNALLEISQVACSLSPEQKIANEALAAINDLSGYILCEKEPVGEVTGVDDEWIHTLRIGTKLYRARSTK